MEFATKKLKVTWKKPLHVNDTLSLVLYRYKENIILPTCENMTTIGELVYETKIIDEGFFDDEVESGIWHYAIYAKNKAGLSPCAIDTYEIDFDTDGDGVKDEFDLYPFNPLRASGQDSDQDGIDNEFDDIDAGIKIDSISMSDMDVTFTVIALGADIYAWRYKIDEEVFQAGNNGTVTVTMTADGVHTITAQGLNENGDVLTEDIESFDLEQPSVITITDLVLSTNNNPTVTVSVQGTKADKWGYEVKDVNGQVVSFTDPQIDLSGTTRTIETTNLTEGQVYTYEVFVLDENGETLDTDSANINLPRSGADFLWGTNIAAGEYGVAQPVDSKQSGSQGAYRVRRWSNPASADFTDDALSVKLSGFINSTVFTNTPDTLAYGLYSAVFEDMIPEKWYNVVFTSSNNNAGNAVLRMYVNSMLVSQLTRHLDQQSSNDYDLLIGALYQSSWRLDGAFNGRIDQPAFWSRGLSQSDVDEIYNNGNGSAYQNWTAGLKANSITCVEFDQASTLTVSNSPNTISTTINGFGHNVNKTANTDAGLLTVGADFNAHPVTQPGGKVSPHAFTPCFLTGLRDGINPNTGNQYTSNELADFYDQSTRKVAAIHLNNPSANPRYIPRDHEEYAISVWAKREGRGVGSYSPSAPIRGNNVGFLVSEYTGWSLAKQSKFYMYAQGPSYELDQNSYWMYGK
jgi:hypothetical protein